MLLKHLCRLVRMFLADSFGNELNIARGGCFQGTVVREPGFILGDSTQTQVRFTFLENAHLLETEARLQLLYGIEVISL